MTDPSDEEIVIDDPALVAAIEQLARDEGRTVDEVIFDALLAAKERLDRAKRSH